MIKTISNKVNSHLFSTRNKFSNFFYIGGIGSLEATMNRINTSSQYIVAKNGCLDNNDIFIAKKLTNGVSDSTQHKLNNSKIQDSNRKMTNPEDNNKETPIDSTTTKRPEQAAKIIKNSDVICFDVDSTVIQEEGIDELADFCGKGSEVSRVTKEAMGGSMTFQDALKIRLNIIRPTQKEIAEFTKLRPSKLSRGLKNFINHLKSEGKEVYLVSGGFDCLIEPVAKELGIPFGNIYANKLMFWCNGEYACFDTTQPTSRTGGKAEAVAMIKKKCPDTVITMIGDGATDLEAVPPADYFIGFGGNVVRNEVFAKAQYYVTDFDQLYFKE